MQQILIKLQPIPSWQLSLAQLSHQLVLFICLMNILLLIYLFTLKDIELLIPAQTGNQIVKMYTHHQRIMSVDYLPPTHYYQFA